MSSTPSTSIITPRSPPPLQRGETPLRTSSLIPNDLILLPARSPSRDSTLYSHDIVSRSPRSLYLDRIRGKRLKGLTTSTIPSLTPRAFLASHPHDARDEERDKDDEGRNQGEEEVSEESDMDPLDLLILKSSDILESAQSILSSTKKVRLQLYRLISLENEMGCQGEMLGNEKGLRDALDVSDELETDLKLLQSEEEDEGGGRGGGGGGRQSIERRGRRYLSNASTYVTAASHIDENDLASTYPVASSSTQHAGSLQRSKSRSVQTMTDAIVTPSLKPIKSNDVDSSRITLLRHHTSIPVLSPPLLTTPIPIPITDTFFHTFISSDKIQFPPSPPLIPSPSFTSSPSPRIPRTTPTTSPSREEDHSPSRSRLRYSYGDSTFASSATSSPPSSLRSTLSAPIAWISQHREIIPPLLSGSGRVALDSLGEEERRSNVTKGEGSLLSPKQSSESGRATTQGIVGLKERLQAASMSSPKEGWWGWTSS